jgi:hypothetical protein
MLRRARLADGPLWARRWQECIAAGYGTSSSGPTGWGWQDAPPDSEYEPAALDATAIVRKKGMELLHDPWWVGCWSGLLGLGCWAGLCGWARRAARGGAARVAPGAAPS